MKNSIGLDACKMGWCGVGNYDDELIYGCFESLETLLQTYPNLQRLLIDIPIGLSSKNYSRTVDTKARTFLQKRKSSIFSPPCREALEADNYKEALAINTQICEKGISIQAYNIGAKIKAVDDWFAHKPKTLEVYEAHPELCFKTLNQNRDLDFSKHDKAGLQERLEIILKHDEKLETLYNAILKDYKRYQVKPDDILDAMALHLINASPNPLKHIKDNNTTDETGKWVGIVCG